MLYRVRLHGGQCCCWSPSWRLDVGAALPGRSAAPWSRGAHSRPLRARLPPRLLQWRLLERRWQSWRLQLLPLWRSGASNRQTHHPLPQGVRCPRRRRSLRNVRHALHAVGAGVSAIRAYFFCARTQPGIPAWLRAAHAAAVTADVTAAHAASSFARTTSPTCGTPLDLRTRAAPMSTRCCAPPGRRSTSSCSASGGVLTTRCTICARRCGTRHPTLGLEPATREPCSPFTTPRRTQWTRRGLRSRSTRLGHIRHGRAFTAPPASHAECMPPPWAPRSCRCSTMSAVSVQVATARGW